MLYKFQAERSLSWLIIVILLQTDINFLTIIVFSSMLFVPPIKNFHKKEESMKKKSPLELFIQNFDPKNVVKVNKSSSKKIPKKVRRPMNAVIRLFESVDDPRINRCKLYPIVEILLCIFIGILYGAKSYYNIVNICTVKITALRMFSPFINGIPSHDTINRIMQILDAKMLEDLFRIAMSQICGSLKNKHIAIDGKAIKNATPKDSKSKCIMVSAYVCDDDIVIAQEKVKEKSNEIVAVPEILRYLKLDRTTITMDAMGLQRETVDLLVERGGDYVICLKGNQKGTYEDVKLLVDNIAPDDEYIEDEKQSGKVITRHCKIFTRIDMMQEAYRWTNLKTVVCLEKTTFYKDETTNETRYFLSSLDVNAHEHCEIIRNHWSIENNLHRTLDVDFEEDKSTKRRGNSAQNFSLFRKIAISYFNKFFPDNLTMYDKNMILLLRDDVLYELIMSF